MKNSELLYQTALKFLGKDASPLDVAPDEYGCAESVNAVYKSAFGKEIGGSTSTYLMYKALLVSPDFTQVKTPQKGDIIISPTGLVTSRSNGHVGIVGDYSYVYSNNSANGMWDTHLTLDVWAKRYDVIFYFRCVETSDLEEQVKTLSQKLIELLQAKLSTAIALLGIKK